MPGPVGILALAQGLVGGHHRVCSCAATVCNCTLEAGIPAAHTGCHAWTREVLITHRLAHQILWGGGGRECWGEVRNCLEPLGAALQPPSGLQLPRPRRART